MVFKNIYLQMMNAIAYVISIVWSCNATFVERLQAKASSQANAHNSLNLVILLHLDGMLARALLLYLGISGTLWYDEFNGH